MSEADFERVRRAFLAARALEGAARQAELDRQCGSDLALRAEVESLLEHHDRQGDTTPVAEAAGRLLDAAEPPLPRSFGAFELLDVVGRGGMGTVYRARQRTPDRIVALKVVRAGMVSPWTLRRFRHEVDLLARLQHPGIAQIHEAGVVRVEGVDVPYFAMELVSGRQIDLHVAERRLSIRERLDLFAKACDAVHHAHQRGVIHRDLKPGNVLVDDAGQPRILDFGIARAVDADRRATTLGAEAGQLVGTLPYMSPEQLSDGELDARSDVHALGVLLFELLTGRLPHDLRGKSFADAVLALRDGQPARLGSVDPALRGDLETIAAKAMERDPARRYESAAALADDVRRYLASRPIVARPPSAAYQLKLFARRHWALVTSGALAAAALVLGSAVSVAFGLRAQGAATREARQRLVAERTSDLLGDILMLADPHGQGASLSLEETLDLMARRLDEGGELPEVEARVRAALGRAYLGLRRTGDALVQLRRAAELWRVVDPEGARLAEVLLPLGIASFQIGDGASGEEALREALAIRERRGEDATAESSSLLDGLIRRGKFAEARPLAEEGVNAARASGNDHALIIALRRVAKVQAGLGEPEEAMRFFEEAGGLVERALDEGHPLRIVVPMDHSVVALQAGDLRGAVEASTTAFERAMRAGAPGSRDWLFCVNNHLSILEAAAMREEMISALERVQETLAATVGPDHRLVHETARRLDAARNAERSDLRDAPPLRPGAHPER